MWKAKLTCGNVTNGVVCPCINYPFEVREANPGKETLIEWQRELANTAFKVHKAEFPTCPNSDDKFITNGLALVKFQMVSVNTVSDSVRPGSVIDAIEGREFKAEYQNDWRPDDSTGDRPTV